ncbi:hypothetical protein AMTRI_Chr10g232450 [Amborella trichopoda]
MEPKPEQAAAQSEELPHVLVFPAPYHGHATPLFSLAAALATHGLHITILVLPCLPSLSAFMASASSRLLPISFLSLPAPAPAPHSPDLHTIIHSLSLLSDPIRRLILDLPSPPTALISDMFLGFTEPLARSFSIPRFTFYPSGAYATSIFHSIWLNNPPEPTTEPTGPIAPTSSSSPITLSDVPSAPSFEFGQLSGLFVRYKRAERSIPLDPTWASVRDCWLWNIESHGRVLNTFADAEGEFLSHLGPVEPAGRVWAVGPLHMLAESGTEGEGLARAEEWLKGRAEGSVVYVCFGTMASFNQDQVDAMASGLKTSGAKFLWVMPNHWELPPGFESSIQDHGAVLRGWVPQARVLGHKAIGAFLTHCGWNSVLEGLAAGVPMVGWPLGAEQHLNARLLVEGLRVGVLVTEGKVGGLDPGSLARAVARVMKPRSTERVHARLMGEAARQAVVPGGSSRVDLEGLVEELMRLHAKGITPK